MNIEELRSFYLSLPYVTESFPFGEEHLVVKVGSKVFAIISLLSEESCISLKCDPERAVELRVRYDSIVPGYHLNKQHWNTVYLRRELPDSLLRELVQHSYDLVWAKLTKRERNALSAGA
ncbi:MAG: MmcQ/YjbR family DNA-binding protein [Porphyromonas sp.]|nr:MmcQ/YjbR family DNA-binding protein [Porphyromonas sp.]